MPQHLTPTGRNSKELFQAGFLLLYCQNMLRNMKGRYVVESCASQCLYGMQMPGPLSLHIAPLYIMEPCACLIHTKPFWLIGLGIFCIQTLCTQSLGFSSTLSTIIPRIFTRFFTSKSSSLAVMLLNC